MGGVIYIILYHIVIWIFGMYKYIYMLHEIGVYIISHIWMGFCYIMIRIYGVYIYGQMIIIDWLELRPFGVDFPYQPCFQ